MISKEDFDIIEQILHEFGSTKDSDSFGNSLESSFSENDNATLAFISMCLELFLIKRYMNGEAEELEEFVEVKIKALVKQFKKHLAN